MRRRSRGNGAIDLAAQMDKVRGYVDAIKDLFERIAQATNVKAGRTAGRRGRPGKRGRPGRARGRGRAAVKAVRRGRKGTRAPRGALKAAIRKVLAGGQAMKPVEVVKALPKAGISHPKYLSVYMALRNDAAIKKTPEGFKLKKKSA